MPPPRPKNRKRKAPRQLLGSASSVSLRPARELIGSGNHTEALAALNTLAKTSRNTTRRAKILLLVGESETKLSRHAATAAAYSKASAFARQTTDLNLLMQTASGEIRALLRALRTEEGKTATTTLLAELDQARLAHQNVEYSCCDGSSAFPKTVTAEEESLFLNIRSPSDVAKLPNLPQCYIDIH